VSISTSLGFRILMGFSTSAVGHTYSHALAFVRVRTPFNLFISRFKPSYTPQLLHVYTHQWFVRIRTPRVRVRMPSRSYALRGLIGHTQGISVCTNEPGGLFALPRARRMSLRSFASPVPFATSQCMPDEYPRPSVHACVQGMERWAAEGSGSWGGRSRV